MSKQAYEYVLFGQIQDFKEKYYQETGSGISFRDAVAHLTEEGKQTLGFPEIPDFLSWNLSNYNVLRELIRRIPVPLSDVLDVTRRDIGSVIHLSTKNRVQISLEACYSDDQLIATDYFSVTYVLEGTCSLSLNHAVRTMQAGELCILPPRTPYSVFTRPKDLVINIISEKTHFKENFHTLLYHDNILSAFFRKALFQDIKEGIFFMLPPTRDVRSLIQHLFAEFLKKDTYSTNLFQNYLQIFYTNIIRSTESTYQFYSVKPDTPARILMPAILKYIAGNYHTLSLSSLSAQFHYESTYLSKLIKESTGKNYSTLITELKCQEAAGLLLTTAKKIDEIAEITGYHSADHFTCSFKKITGLSPRAYRKEHASP